MSRVSGSLPPKEARRSPALTRTNVCRAILNVEALRVAQARSGNKPLTGQQVRWGFEHMKVDDARLKQLGAYELVPAAEAIVRGS